jgi:hypothetical protein
MVIQNLGKRVEMTGIKTIINFNAFMSAYNSFRRIFSPDDAFMSAYNSFRRIFSPDEFQTDIRTLNVMIVLLYPQGHTIGDDLPLI